jgi:hypothetical protein
MNFSVSVSIDVHIISKDLFIEVLTLRYETSM